LSICNNCTRGGQNRGVAKEHEGRAARAAGRLPLTLFITLITVQEKQPMLQTSKGVFGREELAFKEQKMWIDWILKCEHTREPAKG
jgi:hypothetical protein